MVFAVKPGGIGKGNHPNSRANLIGRPTGKDANPNGRPPAGESFNDALRFFLDMPRWVMLRYFMGEAELPPERDNMRHVLAFAQVMQSLFDQTSRTFTMNKLDGMPKQSQEIEYKDEPPAVKAIKDLQQAMRNGNGASPQ